GSGSHRGAWRPPSPSASNGRDSTSHAALNRPQKGERLLHPIALGEDAGTFVNSDRHHIAAVRNLHRRRGRRLRVSPRTGLPARDVAQEEHAEAPTDKRRPVSRTHFSAAG